MELHQLRYFLAVAETQSFTAAARRCEVAQPSLSQQIGKLERRLGTPLFDRLARGVQLTRAGEELVPYARHILTSVEDAQRHVADMELEPSGRLRIGAIPTIAPYLLPPVLRSFLRRSPRVELQLIEEVTDRLIQLLLEGEIDLALMALPIEHPALLHETLFDEELLVAVPARHPLAKRKSLTWEHLDGERIVVMDEIHCLGRQTLSICRRRRINPDIVCRGNQISTILEMVSLGMGITLVPEMAIRSDRSSRRVYRRIKKNSPVRTLAVAWHRDRYRSETSRQLVRLLTASS